MQILSVAITIIGLIAFVLACMVGIAGRAPNDGSVIGVIVLELLMILMAALNVIGLAVGNPTIGPGWEIIGYVIAGVAIPIVGLYWALSEKDRWSNFVLAIACLSVVIINIRIQQLWYGG